MSDTKANVEANLNRGAGLKLLIVLLFNSVIAGFLTLVLPEACFWRTFVISQCIGLTIFFVFKLYFYYFEFSRLGVVLVLLLGSIAGVAVAYMMSSLFYGQFLPQQGKLSGEQASNLALNLFLALFFGSIILYFFISREKQFQASQDLKEAQLKHSDHKKQMAETQLQLLQAQIEPHFLFNSLSNVVSLMELDTPRAKRMLESLTHYLRASLSRSHDKNGSLQDELDLIENYLKILQIRMGDRLTYHIDVDEKLLSHPFPIMLLQPVVENAIKHGLEEKAEGGRVEVHIAKEDNRLLIRISDDGVGLKQGDLKGFGLMNVRKRLQNLYGEKGNLRIENNSSQGVRVTIEMPYE